MSSKRHIRRKACGRKYRYTSVEAAVDAAFQRTRVTRTKIQAYRCRFCKGWHIGHAPKWVQRKLGYGA